MSLYLASCARDQLDHAQQQVDEHAASGYDGRCLTCHQVEPCPARLAASAIFTRYGRLPHRTPGWASRGVR